MKIVSSGKVLNTSKLYKKKRRRKIFKFSAFLFLFSSFISSLVYLSRQEEFLVSEIVISGDDIVGRAEMIESVSSILDSYYLWLIPKANITILPRSEIRATLLESFKRLKSIELNVDGGILTVTPEERVPVALYCSSVAGVDCYFIDSEALIFARAPSFSGPSYFIYSTEESISEPIGINLLATEELFALSRFVESLKDLNIFAESLEIGNDNYTLLTDKRMRIMWKKEHDLEKTYSNLSAFLSEESIRTQEDFLERVEYLDLKVEDKVFYRFWK